MSHLRPEDRNPVEALRLLEAAAANAQGAGLQPARDAFFGLSPQNRLALLENVQVIDSAANLQDLARKIDSVLGFPVKREYRDPFRERLEGWWFARVVERLALSTSPPISAVDLAAAMDGIRDSFHEEALPIDYADARPDQPPLTEDTRLFVRQLRAIQLGAKTIDWARVDFYRAFEQRSRWIRDQLLAADELDRYDRALLEYWQREFDRHLDEMNQNDGEPAFIARGRVIYTKCTESCPQIRPKCTEPYVGRGSMHVLSDNGSLGWHPKYRERLLAGEAAT